jgi:hypothetical protein
MAKTTKIACSQRHMTPENDTCTKWNGENPATITGKTSFSLPIHHSGVPVKRHKIRQLFRIPHAAAKKDGQAEIDEIESLPLGLGIRSAGDMGPTGAGG